MESISGHRPSEYKKKYLKQLKHNISLFFFVLLKHNHWTVTNYCYFFYYTLLLRIFFSDLIVFYYILEFDVHIFDKVLVITYINYVLSDKILWSD